MTATTATVVTTEEVAAWTGPPLYLFIGISTAGSSVHRAFPVWAPVFAPGACLRGVDLPEDADPEQFRRLLVAMRDNPAVHGAVVTSHKLRLHRAAHDLLDAADTLVHLTHEINSLDTRDGVRAFARDAESLDVVLRVPGVLHGGAPLVCIGAGGSAIALLLATRLDVPATITAGAPVPAAAARPLTILGRRQASLDEIAGVAQRCGIDQEGPDLVLATDSVSYRARLTDLPAGSVVINATGLGKTAPGSPLAGPEAFPPGIVAWDFNYRGPLTFLEQARAAGVPTEDGWDYFLAGWSCALAAITGTELTDERFADLVARSSSLRP
ncbi:hypothetical protein [Nakamurella leprariae]|uniref:Shikimate dehydrogenase n=1 Tax=Nakamurella leprariae TaxID=2803911 RepID=A0A938YDI9_9ACTN|nr:hypothetical protein [Nakamurella leprariae]MBM9467854.1 hypothetical protein [Nakamurella leprariae]